MLLFTSLRGTWSISEMLFTACAPVYSRTSGESLAVDSDGSDSDRINNQKSMKNQTTGDVESSFLLKVIGSRSFQVHFVFMYILCVWYIIHIVPKTATRDSPFHRSHGFGRPSADKPSLKVDSRGNEKWPVKTCIDWFVPTKLIYQIWYTLREYKGWPLFLREFTLYLTKCIFPGLMRECDMMCW